MRERTIPHSSAPCCDAKSAHEDRLQARNAMLPTITATSQYLGTQGDGGKISDGRFVTNDGIHVYRAWGVFHQDLSPALFMGTGYKRAKAGEALANAKAEIARRGLTVTVSKNFYGLVVAQRKYATAQQALDQAKHFLDITQDGEHQGQARPQRFAQGGDSISHPGAGVRRSKTGHGGCALEPCRHAIPDLQRKFHGGG